MSRREFVNRYDGVCVSKRHRPLDEDTGEPLAYFVYKADPDAVKVKAGDGFVFPGKGGRWLTQCAECKAQADERRDARKQAKAAVWSMTPGTAAGRAAAEETAIAVVSEPIAETVVPDVIEKPKPKHEAYNADLNLDELFG